MNFLNLFLVLVHFQFLKANDECNKPLLFNVKITSSSMSPDWGPDRVELGGNDAWTANSSDFSQYLIFDLGRKRNITAIATQGRPFTSEFVQEYGIEYNNEAKDYYEYRDHEGNSKLFAGNVDGDSIKLNKFETPIIAQWVRINPTKWRDRISMRVELYGCDYVSENGNFDGQSYFTKELHSEISSEKENIRFRFRTSEPDGIIFYSSGNQGDFFCLQLIDSKLLYNIYLGDEGVITNISVGRILDDNKWHHVHIFRHRRNVILTLDTVVLKEQIQGDFLKLNLNQGIHVGGVPNINQDEIIVKKNFTGCIEDLFYNNTNFIHELRTNNLLYKQYGKLTYSCLDKTIPLISFLNPDAHIKLPGHRQSVINCSFDFRTFNEDGLLLYHKFSDYGYMKVYIEKGNMKVELQGEITSKVATHTSDQYLSDGLWHQIRLILLKNRMELHVDKVPSITTRQFSFLPGDEYLIGGGLNGSQGFVGCMRSIHVEGNYVNVSSLPQHSLSSEGVVRDVCQMTDWCSPNPCEHGGVCKQNKEEFECKCEKTGYSGAVCHTPLNFISCEAYKFTYPEAKEVDIDIDIDGSGPLDPFPVSCKYPSEGPAVTILHHKNEKPTDVKGFSAAGSFIQDIIYNAEMEQIVQLVKRYSSCRQNLRYDCYKTHLFNSPSAENTTFQPSSWWVSRSNQQMDYWGGSLPGSRKCNCGLYGTCKDPSKWCNCDSEYDRDEWLADEGYLTQKEFLPVRQLRIGDTGSTMDEKKGRYTLGPLICEGDTLFDNTITFFYEDATVDLPSFVMGHSGDIYLQFKTTAENGVLLNSRGPTDFIKLLLVEGDKIQFQYNAGNGPITVSVETSYKLNDNNWHSVLVERNHKQARVVVDENSREDVKERADSFRSLYLTSKLVMGATVDYREGFVGCMRALMLNGEIVDLQHMAQEYSYGIGKGCVGKCQSSPCLNNGTCIEGYSSYACDCQWTGFKGPICATEIGVNLNSNSYVRYDFENTTSTFEEYIHVGFTTVEKTGMIVGISAYSGEYVNLILSIRGHLHLVFDFGFGRQKIFIRNQNFALGQHHDIGIFLADRGSKITISVDNYDPIVYTFYIDEKSDGWQLKKLKSLYIGKNESMGIGNGFFGCISRVQYNDNFPLRRLFQENRPSNVWSVPENIKESDCEVIPVTHSPEKRVIRPFPSEHVSSVTPICVNG